METCLTGFLHTRILADVLRRPSEIATSAIKLILELMNKLPQADSMDALRGYEGKAATLYFQALGLYSLVYLPLKNAPSVHQLTQSTVC